MPEILDDIAYLSQEIGPRPAGTEEEQQAALYITEQLQKKAKFQTSVEDFSCVSQPDIVKLICFGLPILFSIAALITSVFVIPAIILSALCAVLYVLEITGKPILSRAFQHGVSQNIVAQYIPATLPGEVKNRRRKIVLVANYDSGKVQKEYGSGIAGAVPLIRKASLVALIALPILWLIRATALSDAQGAGSLILTILCVVCIVLIACPVVVSVMHKTATYNEAANNNASGVAVMLETARRIAAGRLSIDELIAQREAEENGVEIHGKDAAAAAGVIPQGADVVYQADATVPTGAAQQQRSTSAREQDQLAAAKAAVAALTGEEVPGAASPRDISENLVQVKAGPIAQPSQKEIEADRARTHAVLTGADRQEASAAQREAADQQQAQAQSTAQPEQFSQQANTAQQPVQPQESAQQGAGRQDAMQQQPQQAAAQQRVDQQSVASQQPAQQNPAQQQTLNARGNQQNASRSYARPTSADRSADRSSADAAVPDWFKKAQKKANREGANTAKPEQRSRYASALDQAVAVSAEHFQEANQIIDDRTNARLTHDAGGIVAVEPPKRFVDRLSQNQEGTNQSGTQAASTPAPAPKAAGSAQQTSMSTSAPVKPAQQMSSSAPAQPDQSARVNTSIQETVPQAAQQQNPSTEHPAVTQRDEESRPQQTEASYAGANQAAPVAPATATAPEASAASAQPDVSHTATFDSAEDADRTTAMAPLDISDLRSQIASSNELSAARALQSRPSQNLTSSARENVDRVLVDDSQEDVTSSTAAAPSANGNAHEVHDFSQIPQADDQQSSSALSSGKRRINSLIGTVRERIVAPEARDHAGMQTNHTDAHNQVEMQDRADAQGQQPQQDQQPGQKYQSEVHNRKPSRPSAFSARRTASDDDPTAQASAIPPVVLPDVPESDLPPVVELTKQRAPLAEAAAGAKSAHNNDLSAQIPRISLDSAASRKQQQMPDNKRAALRSTLPSMSGSISVEPPVDHKQGESTSNNNNAVSLTGSFSAVGSNGAFAPVGDELVADVDPEERYVDDADDSSYDTNVTETGAFAGPDYMEMPKSRFGRLFGKLGRHKKHEAQEQSTDDWLGVDESFDARNVGKQRGGWESFQEGSSFEQEQDAQFAHGQQPNDDAYYDDAPENGYDEPSYDDENGYAAAPEYNDGSDYGDASYDNGGRPTQGYNDENDYDNNAADATQVIHPHSHRRHGGRSDHWQGGAYSKRAAQQGEQQYADGPESKRVEAAAAGAGQQPISATQPVPAVQKKASKAHPKSGVDPAVEEVRKIYKFRNPDVNLDVWFVALGSELPYNGGMHAFLNEHADDLRGAVVINLEALGSGALTYMESEGTYLTKHPSSRMKRYIKKAQQETGVSVATHNTSFKDGPAYVALNQGIQAMSLVGIEDGKPAGIGQADDVLENIDPETLENNADFIYSLVKSI
ncbi:MAG: M28 family peptidase [Eggerthellaceae bacterium]|jgi:hypothetical protein|nr:M28 family peptidase [Eggerthellaceae bacterium]MCH4220527.1 M28 family peptidase [Eggerthellaceae bacterium]